MVLVKKICLKPPPSIVLIGSNRISGRLAVLTLLNYFCPSFMMIFSIFLPESTDMFLHVSSINS